MTPEQARKAIFDALADIAPEVDSAALDEHLDLPEQVDLDSMDYLNWLIGISEATGIDIPQRDMRSFLTVAGAVDYLVRHAS